MRKNDLFFLFFLFFELTENCILPILQEMSIEEADTKVLSQYFQCIY